MADIFCSNLSQLRQIPSSGLANLTEAYVGVLRSKFIWIDNEAGQDDGQTVILPDDLPASGRWINPQSPLIPNQTLPWSGVVKTGSKLSDLDNRSASDLNSGTIHPLRLPQGIPYFNAPAPKMILTTDENGAYKLSHIDFTQIDRLIPFAKIDWASFLPNMVGAESLIYFNPDQFDRDSLNNVSIKLMTNDQAGLAIPGIGVEADEAGRINVIYGTGKGQALEGITPLGGDLGGVHESAVVDALRNVPLTFFPNELAGKDGYVLKLDVKNAGLPFFYLAPESCSGGSGSSGSSLPPITGNSGALLTDGSKAYWGLIPESFIKPNFAITSFNTPVHTLEIGQEIANPTFTASYNDAVGLAVLTDSLGETSSILDPTNFHSPFTFRYTTITTVTFTLKVNPVSSNLQYTASEQISWEAKIFYGSHIVDSDPLVIINGLQGQRLASNRSGSFTANPSALQYIYYAIPSSFGSEVTFTVNGFSGGFTKVATDILVTNSFGVELSYDLWRSDNPGLGLTNVDVS
jgi:hypothetical protein